MDTGIIAVGVDSGTPRHHDTEVSRPLADSHRRGGPVCPQKVAGSAQLAIPALERDPGRPFHKGGRLPSGPFHKGPSIYPSRSKARVRSKGRPVHPGRSLCFRTLRPYVVPYANCDSRKVETATVTVTRLANHNKRACHAIPRYRQ